MMKTVISISSLVFRHLIASVVSIAAPVILVIVTYFVLLAIAIITNSRLGSPVALPLWALFALVAATAYTSSILFPSVLIAEIISRRFRKWQHLAQIPISIVVLGAIIVGLNLTLRSVPHATENLVLAWADYPLHVILLLMIPLGLYWWTTKIVQAGIALPGELLRGLSTARGRARARERRISHEP